MCPGQATSPDSGGPRWRGRTSRRTGSPARGCVSPSYRWSGGPVPATTPGAVPCAGTSAGTAGPRSRSVGRASASARSVMMLGRVTLVQLDASRRATSTAGCSRAPGRCSDLPVIEAGRVALQVPLADQGGLVAGTAAAACGKVRWEPSKTSPLSTTPLAWLCSPVSTVARAGAQIELPTNAAPEQHSLPPPAGRWPGVRLMREP